MVTEMKKYQTIIVVNGNCYSSVKTTTDWISSKKSNNYYAGLEERPSGCLGHVHVAFPAGQAAFLAHLPTGQSPRQTTFQFNPKGQARF